MMTDTALIEKREELKRRLSAGEYKTLVDVFLEWFDRLIRKIIRRKKPLALWLITLLLSLGVSSITFGARYVDGGLTGILNFAELYGVGYGLGILVMISLTALTVTSVVLTNQSIRRIIVLWHDEILDATESVASLREFEDWLEKVCNLRLQIIIAIFGGLSIGLFVIISISAKLGAFVGYGQTFGTIFINVFSTIFYYQGFMVILLPVMLRKYDLKLFAADPATSKPLSHLSSELSFFVYFIAVYSTLITLATGALRASQSTDIVVVLFLWLPIITMFALNQTSLSSIVRRAKWKTLNEIQAKVEKLQAAENLEAKETMDAINRLLDYHERVNKTRNSAVDLRTILGFINSLLLPVLAFLLDKVLPLFKGKP